MLAYNPRRQQHSLFSSSSIASSSDNYHPNFHQQIPNIQIDFNISPSYQQPSSIPPFSNPSTQTSYNIIYPISPPSSPEIDYDQSIDCCYESPRFTDSGDLNLDASSYQLMQANSQWYNPQLRVQQATPSPRLSDPTADLGPSMLDQNDSIPRYSWNDFENTNIATSKSSARQLRVQNGSSSSHNRLPSGSSIGSGGPTSPYTQTSEYPRIVDTDSPSYESASGLPHYDTDYNAGGLFAKPLPTPFLTSSGSQGFNNGSNSTNTFYGHDINSYDVDPFMAVTMRQAMAEQQASSAGDHMPSVSRTSYSEDLEQGIKAGNVAKLDRTMSDVYQDELYNPAATPAPAPSSRPFMNQSSSLLSPHSTVFFERVQAANKGHLNARSQSPASNVSRERSPFRQDSPYVTEGLPGSPIPRLGSATRLREQKKAEADTQAYLQHHQTSTAPLEPPTTISPKEAVLEFNENESDITSNSPMAPFSQRSRNSAMNANGRFPSPTSNDRGLSHGNAFDECTERHSSSQHEVSSRQTPSSGPASSQEYQFAPPAVPGTAQNSAQYPFISHSRRQTNSMRSTDSVPEFPSRLTSMESTKSEPKSEPDRSAESSPAVQRPSNTMADSGTYTCTYHGCALRFETPDKLQKHKRAGHRQSTPQRSAASANVAARKSISGSASGSGTGNGSDSASSAAATANRNSQAGPHKCERINPSTGKPCNTVFSRPYDLTRHEDTIHNARKQKVRCHLCTEEKTFSRNDALTRHMRVVHPEVDFPGKTKKRG